MYTEELIRQTNAYRIISGEKSRGALSHAYLIVCPDGEYLREYLKIFAKLIMCENGDGCGECRPCRLIEKEAYADCTFYPQSGNKILTADIDDLIPQTYIRPLENKTRLFVLSGVENMAAAPQNKLLKTLEEPPANVCILMGATSDYSLLPTIKSRVKKIDVPPFSETALYGALSRELGESEKLRRAVGISGGKLGAALAAYGNGATEKTAALCKKIIKEMKSSKDVAKFIGYIDKDNISDFISVMKNEIMDMLKAAVSSGTGDCDGYKVGALLAIEDVLSEKERALAFNANVQMAADGILFSIVEEKFRWQKL